jgi:hypothetical protein
MKTPLKALNRKMPAPRLNSRYRKSLKELFRSSLNLFQMPYSNAHAACGNTVAKCPASEGRSGKATILKPLSQ